MGHQVTNDAEVKATTTSNACGFHEPIWQQFAKRVERGLRDEVAQREKPSRSARSSDPNLDKPATNVRRSDDEGDILAQFVAKTWPQQMKKWRWLSEYWDDDRYQLNLGDVEAGMNRERSLMNKL